MRMDRSAKHVPTTAPWAAPRAREWDTTNFGEWLDANVRTEDGRALLGAAFTTIWAEDPHGLNLLGALSRIHEAGGFENLTQTRGGMLQDRVVGGATEIAELSGQRDRRPRIERRAGGREHACDRAPRDRRGPARAGAAHPVRAGAARHAPEGA
jgi:hypothetical protein